jgi:hypothetical protein
MRASNVYRWRLEGLGSGQKPQANILSDRSDQGRQWTQTLPSLRNRAWKAQASTQTRFLCLDQDPRPGLHATHRVRNIRRTCLATTKIDNRALWKPVKDDIDRLDLRSSSIWRSDTSMIRATPGYQTCRLHKTRCSAAIGTTGAMPLPMLSLGPRRLP